VVSSHLWENNEKEQRDMDSTPFSHLRDQKLNFSGEKRTFECYRDRYFIDELHNSEYFVKGIIINMKMLTSP
jgi:hypothetical protein